MHLPSTHPRWLTQLTSVQAVHSKFVTVAVNALIFAFFFFIFLQRLLRLVHEDRCREDARAAWICRTSVRHPSGTTGTTTLADLNWLRMLAVRRRLVSSVAMLKATGLNAAALVELAEPGAERLRITFNDTDADDSRDKAERNSRRHVTKHFGPTDGRRCSV